MTQAVQPLWVFDGNHLFLPYLFRHVMLFVIRENFDEFLLALAALRLKFSITTYFRKTSVLVYVI